MIERWYKNGLIFGIIVLFFGASITPNIGGVKENISNELSELENSIVTYQIKNRNIDSLENDYCQWWPMFKHDAHHSGYSTSSAPDTNNVKWTFSKSGEGRIPSVENNKVYVCIGNVFYCLDEDDGSQIWSVTNLLSFGSAIVGNRVYVSGFYHFTCLNATDGSKIWTYSMGGKMSVPPVVSDGKVYYGSDTKKLYCLDADDGTPLWTYTTGGVVRSSPAVWDGKVYFGSHDRKLYCLNADNGSEIWTYKTGYEVTSSPAIIDGKVYFGSYDGNMYCLYAENGTKIWSYKTTTGWIRSSPAIAYGYVYFAADDTNIYCLDSENGEKIWSYKTTYNNLNSPSVADDKVYVGTEYQKDSKYYSYYLTCLNAYTGEEIWRYSLNGRGLAPAIADGKVYVCSNNGKMYCFGDEEPNLYCDGSLSWTKAIPGELVTGNFTVENIGESGTKLDWEITEYPTWGVWSFLPSYGEDLLPEDGPFTVEVGVTAPDEYNKIFNGIVKVCNQENPCDYQEIDVSLSTIFTPDIYCEGDLRWTNVKVGSTVTGNFTVSNNGESGSFLDWEITEWPGWGSNWEFNPNSGDDLKPEDGPVMIDVNVQAPSEPNYAWTGEIKIVNVENTSNFCSIPVYLKTPRNKALSFNLFEWLFERFPLFKQMLDLVFREVNNL